MPHPIELTRVAPVIRLDAIWVTLLAATEPPQPDRLQRRRRVQTRQKVGGLVGLGLYPQSGRWGILAGPVAETESQAAWEAWLLPLEQPGVSGQPGVEGFLHAGGSGFIAALNRLDPNLPQQPCRFHQLPNRWHSVHPPKGWSGQDVPTFKPD